MTPRAVFRTSALCTAAALTLLVGSTVAPALAVEAPALTVSNANDSGPGSLRAAVEAANAAEGPDTIGFASGVSEILLDSPLQSSDALTIAGNGVVIRAGDNWSNGTSNPEEGPAPDALLSTEYAPLALDGLTFDAAQTAEHAVWARNLRGEDALSLTNSTLRNPTVSAVSFSEFTGALSISGSTFEQQDPGNLATGINGDNSATAAVSVSNTSISGFMAGGAAFYEWNDQGESTAQIAFDRVTMTGNGNPESPEAQAGAISLMREYNNASATPRLTVTDSSFSKNSGHFAGGIAVSAPAWNATPDTTLVRISGSTFLDNFGGYAADLSELPVPSRMAPAQDVAPAVPADGDAKPLAFDVANSTFVSTDEFPSTVLAQENPGTRSVFTHVTVLNGFVSVSSWTDSPVFEMRDSVINSGDRLPIDQPQPVFAAAAEADEDPEPQPAPYATSLRSAYIWLPETGQPKFESTDDVVVADPAELKLGFLADNGGLTLTVLPQAGSPLIDAGEAGTSLAPDQRGVSRPQGPRADIGAVEVEVSTPPTTTPPTTTPPTTTPPTTTTPPPTTVPPTTTQPGTTVPPTSSGPSGTPDATDPLAQTGAEGQPAPWMIAGVLSALLGTGILLARRARAQRAE